jgi:hypothetical protein
VKRKGCRREAGSEGSVEQRCEPMNKNRIRGASAGRAGNESRKSISIKGAKRRSGGCAPKAIELTPGDLSRVAARRLRWPRGRLTAWQKSAEGIVGQAVGKASEALQRRKAEQQIGRAGNEDRRPERSRAASRTGNS